MVLSTSTIHRFSLCHIGITVCQYIPWRTLAHFPAPPVLMISGKLHWDTAYMFAHFECRALLGLVLSTILYELVFRKEFPF
jgi:hypothetical protein